MGNSQSSQSESRRSRSTSELRASYERLSREMQRRLRRSGQWLREHPIETATGGATGGLVSWLLWRAMLGLVLLGLLGLVFGFLWWILSREAEASFLFEPALQCACGAPPLSGEAARALLSRNREQPVLRHADGSPLPAPASSSSARMQVSSSADEIAAAAVEAMLNKLQQVIEEKQRQHYQRERQVLAGALTERAVQCDNLDCTGIWSAVKKEK